ncbi:MAG: hypothetical protein J6K89_08385, partial [Oscillospiraceae bacterium]|nr:hypothetical protein [Oscillospiraceae bacterium]
MNTKTTENNVFPKKSKHFSQPPILGACRTRNARPYEGCGKFRFVTLFETAHTTKIRTIRRG